MKTNHLFPIRSLIYPVLWILLVLPFVLAHAQDETEHEPIDAANFTNLHAVQQLDFADLPPEIENASGQFVMSADAHRIVSFGNRAGDAPFSQAIIWEDGEIIGVSAIEGDSIVRELSADGNCLYVGYQGYLRGYQLNEVNPTPEYLHADLPNPDDIAVNFWAADSLTCDTDFFVEIAATDGQLYSGQVDPTGNFALLDELFNLPDVTTAARVGRIPPPLALTIDFDGNLYRWDLTDNQVTGQVNVGEIAMFGKLNRVGTHYMWLSSAQDGLYLADFAAESTQQIVELDEVYISHMILTHAADVVLGVDPYDARGTVSAWSVANGERVELGAYRDCDRTQPDLVQLSRDGARMVIGCDRGLEVWQAN